MENKSIRYLTWGAIIAALYVLLTYLASLLGLASGVIQFRLSEALCIMACFTPAAIPGLYIGCLLSNILTGCVFWDILFGPIATLIGAVGTYLLRRNKYLAVIPPILASIGTFASSINPTIASPAPSENNAQTPPSQMPSQMFPLCHSCAARHI